VILLGHLWPAIDERTKALLSSIARLPELATVLHKKRLYAEHAARLSRDPMQSSPNDVHSKIMRLPGSVHSFVSTSWNTFLTNPILEFAFFFYSQRVNTVHLSHLSGLHGLYFHYIPTQAGSSRRHPAPLLPFALPPTIAIPAFVATSYNE
jgi:hypothetical protein